MRFRLSMSPTSGAARRPLRAWPATVVILGLGLGLGACSKMNDVTGSIGRETALPQGDAALRQYAEQAGRRYDANPRDKANTLTYARALRALSRHSEAVAVLQGLAIHYPHDHDVLGAFGKSGPARSSEPVDDEARRTAPAGRTGSSARSASAAAQKRRLLFRFAHRRRWSRMIPAPARRSVSAERRAVALGLTISADSNRLEICRIDARARGEILVGLTAVLKIGQFRRGQRELLRQRTDCAPISWLTLRNACSIDMPDSTQISSRSSASGKARRSIAAAWSSCSGQHDFRRLMPTSTAPEGRR
jgi:hypothetical protein